MRTKYVLLASILPIGVADLCYDGKFLIWLAQVALAIYIVIFLMCPLLFHYNPHIRQNIVFLNSIRWPLNTNLSDPASVGLKGARNFYLKTDEDVKLGAWQILPKSLLDRNISLSEEAYLSQLRNATRPVFLYMHGNSGNRASSHRLELYELFQSLDYHVICFDYRSYGDSDEVDLSERGVVDDSRYMLEWVMGQVNGSSPVYVWGHSLGTGVSTHVLKILADQGLQSKGLFLEAPFNNIADEVSEHPFSQIFKHLPWFHWTLVKPFTEGDIIFQSDKNIEKIECPIIIFHAEDDAVIPIALGEKLYEAALRSHGNDTQQVQMIRISSSHGLGHKYICRYDKLPKIIEKFVAETF